MFSLGNALTLVNQLANKTPRVISSDLRPSPPPPDGGVWASSHPSPELRPLTDHGPSPTEEDPGTGLKIEPPESACHPEGER